MSVPPEVLQDVGGGVLLNKRGIAKGIDERSLFSGSDREFDRYASDELKEWGW